MAIRRASIERIDISAARARGLLDRVRPKLADEEFRELKALVGTLVYLAELVAHTHASIRRVRALLFGTGSTEKTQDVLTRAGLPDSPPTDRAPHADVPSDREPAARSWPPWRRGVPRRRADPDSPSVAQGGGSLSRL
jgi:hypothetical protein